jgi:hypothetical protein
MFDLRTFWLGTAVYILITGAVIAGVGTAFYAFVGMPAKQPIPQVASQPGPSQVVVDHAAPARKEPEGPAPASRPPPTLRRPLPASDTAVAMPQLFVPAPLIVPERGSSRRRGQDF